MKKQDRRAEHIKKQRGRRPFPTITSFLVKGSSHSLPWRGEVHMHALLMRLAQASGVWWLQGINADFSYKWGAKRGREWKGSNCQDRALQRHGALAHGEEISAKSQFGKFFNG
jgi:hypothetical protein